MVGKKKSTGMGKRSGFLDRDTIAEDRAILRYNESLEDEARRALRPANAGPYGERGRGGRGERGEAGRGPRRDRPAGPPKAPRPPAVEPEVEARLRAAAAEAGAARSLDAEASRLVDRLVRGAKFEVAASAGWDLLVQNRGPDHTPKEWDAFRRDWDGVRQAVGEVWGQTHPDDKPAPIKIRPARKRRGGKRGGGSGAASAGAEQAEATAGAATGGAEDDAAGVDAAAADGTEGLEPRKPRRRRRGGRGRGRRPARPLFVPGPGQVVPVAVVVTVVTPARRVPATGPAAAPADEEITEAEVLEGLPAPDLGTELVAEDSELGPAGEAGPQAPVDADLAGVPAGLGEPAPGEVGTPGEPAPVEDVDDEAAGAVDDPVPGAADVPVAPEEDAAPAGEPPGDRRSSAGVHEPPPAAQPGTDATPDTAPPEAE